MLLFLSLILLALTYTYMRIRQWRLDKLTEKIPGRNTLPLFGNALDLLFVNNITELWNRTRVIVRPFQCEKIFKFWFGPILAVALWEPSCIEKLTRIDLTNKSSLYRMIMGHIMNGVFIAEGGEKWKELRRPIVKSMANKLIVNDYFNVFIQRCNDFGNFLDENFIGQCCNVSHLIGRLFIDMYCETHLGVFTNEVRENKWKFLEQIDKLISLSFTLILKYFPYSWKYFAIFTREKKQLNYHLNETNRFIQWVIDERRRRNFTPEGREDYVDFILRRKSEKKLSDHAIVKELTDFTIAGADTSSVLTSSGVVFLAMHPEIQEKAYQEQHAIFQGSMRNPTSEDISGMEYLDMVVKETLRKICPPGFFRYCNSGANLGKYTLPEGIYVYIYLHGLHTDPEHWERPDEFYPEHFLPEKKAARPRYSFVPFGFGARHCPGSRYAMLSIKTVLSTLLRRFKFSTKVKYEDIVYDYSLLVHMSSGYNVTFERRNS